ncbi:uncharacterized protein THITE_2119332 [Thermothielavioides terrestris NRRL 8126]|uniref:Uncharacterized protein n=1 Tax=Thermothielavioides terrestris (strain ATCC 38088 / NRRL 8126) TaxID=578455 RepID=G2RBM6_THETT|nr:uncharacterized protein THITE_2119332 [Thermothielavioides terrestris NRRL 8126]AEO69197.1 hypothetical protein THITE_2119332 [Thermothielavioides terrestris NRRL 8126]
MAPVDIDHQPGSIPLVLAGLRVVSAAYASYTVGRSLYRSHKALGPAQDTRHRTAERGKLTAAFGSLAALGLVFAVTSSLDYLTLSYKVWASERGIEVPDSLFGNHTLGTNDTGQPALHLGAWLSDTPVYFDALEIVAEKTRRLWWGQQLDLATIAWTALLAVEGRRRRIPHLWAYALLPHLVNLSFAQNLFYVALLQTPVPIASQETRIARAVHWLLPRKPNNWFPKLPVLFLPLLCSYLATIWLPYTAGTPSFPTAVALSKVLTLGPLILPAIAPASWGTVYTDPRDAYPGITKLFNAISTASALIYAKTTVFALLDNRPGSYKHRHSIKIPFDTEKRSRWERTATAVEKVLGALTDHPVVAAAGKDALLCALSLGLWAAVRATDARSMLRAVSSAAPRQGQAAAQRSPSEEATGETIKVELPDAREEGEQEQQQEPAPAAPGLSMTLRRRGRPKKSSVSSTASSDAPTVVAEDTHPTPRRRGRPRKVKQEPEPEPKPEPEHDNLEPEEVPDDKTYEPTPAVRAGVGLGDVLPEDDFDWESAALAWGLTVLAGLGVGSAAVFGAECVSR